MPPATGTVSARMAATFRLVTCSISSSLRSRQATSHDGYSRLIGQR